MDPAKDGGWLFDHQPQRLALASACADGLVPLPKLGEVGSQKTGNAARTAKLLVGWGVLEEVVDQPGEPGYRLVHKWRPAVARAKLRSQKGQVVQRGVVLLIARPGLGSLYEIFADREEPDQRFAWVARLPHHPAFGALVTLNPLLDEGAVERLTLELEQAGIGHERFVVGELSGLEELRQFGAASLPGSFGPGV